MAELKEIEHSNQVSSSDTESLARRIAEAYVQAVRAETEGRTTSGIRQARQDREELLRATPDSIGWHELGYAENQSPGASAEIWGRIRQAAHAELENGHRAADIVASALSPWVRAQFLALRESFIGDWQPKGSIEMRLIDQMAQIYTQYEFWMQMAVQRSAVECQLETSHIKKKGKWVALTIDGNAEMEQAAMMADRFNRLFLRTVRALRDLRRYYPPVIVQNAGQVNVGGQQVNITQAKEDSKRSNSASVINVSPNNTLSTDLNDVKLLQPASANAMCIPQQDGVRENLTVSSNRKKARTIKKKTG
jgi:hypothetical protein